MSVQVAQPLTLVMDIKSREDAKILRTMLIQMSSLPPENNPIHAALHKTGVVHFARLVFLSDLQLALIASYDGDFEAFLRTLAAELGSVFDQLLKYMKDAPKASVSECFSEFLAYVRKNDRGQASHDAGELYAAYPELAVKDIREATEKKPRGVKRRSENAGGAFSNEILRSEGRQRLPRKLAVGA